MSSFAHVLRHLFATVKPGVEQARLPAIEGTLPDDLRGVLFRNGPGRMERGGRRYGHPFDGDGLVTRFEFSADGLHYTHRFVRTREFRNEERAGKVLYRGFGSMKPGGFAGNAFRMRFKNAANTAVVAHGGRLLALWEGGWPHELDPHTLQTRERFSYDGALVNDGSWIDRMANPELPFSAHPCIDPDTGDLHNFGLAFGPKNRLLTYRVAATGELVERRTQFLDELSFAHDFALTRHWYVFLLPAVHFRVGRAVLGLRSPVESLEGRDGEPMVALCVPRDGGEPVAIETSPGFVFHFAGGYENERGQIVVDGMRMGAFPDLRDPEHLVSEPSANSRAALAEPTRFTIDPAERTVCARRLADLAMEVPQVAPAAKGDRNRPDADGYRHRVIWSTAVPEGRQVPFYSSLARLDTASGRLVARDFGLSLPGEPVPVARAGATSAEDGGYILAPLYVAEEHVSDLLVLDADSLETVCRFRLPGHLPQSFHGQFVDAATYQREFGVCPDEGRARGKAADSHRQNAA